MSTAGKWSKLRKLSAADKIHIREPNDAFECFVKLVSRILHSTTPRATNTVVHCQVIAGSQLVNAKPYNRNRDVPILEMATTGDKTKRVYLDALMNSPLHDPADLEALISRGGAEKGIPKTCFGISQHLPNVYIAKDPCCSIVFGSREHLK